MARIRDYNLSLFSPRGVDDGQYKPSWDNYVKNDSDIERLTKDITYWWSRGVTPVVAVFAPKR